MVIPSESYAAITVYALQDIGLYKYFNRTFWKKVDSYGRKRMTEDVRKLRQFRNRKKNQDETQGIPISDYTWEDMQSNYLNSLKTFQEGLKNYHDNEFMIEILKEKLFDHNKYMDFDQLQSLAEYMVQNGGGCPVKVDSTRNNGTN